MRGTIANGRKEAAKSPVILNSPYKECVLAFDRSLKEGTTKILDGCHYSRGAGTTEPYNF
jgi:hypothetical protein